jgi:hypothetical protein
MVFGAEQHFLYLWRLPAGNVPLRASTPKEQTMYFRTVRTVDPVTGKGEIKLDVSGNSVRFQRDVIAWDPEIQPIIGIAGAVPKFHEVELLVELEPTYATHNHGRST